MTNRIQLAYYLWTPAIGGAERYVRDLIWGVNRDRFEITLYHQSWPALETYLGLADCPDLRSRQIQASEPPGTGGGQGVPDSGTAGRIARTLPFRRRLAPSGLAAIRLVLLQRNAARFVAALQDRPPDVLHVINGGYPGATSALALAANGHAMGARACIMTVCSTAYPRASPQIFDRLLDRRVNAGLDLVLAAGKGPIEALQDRRNLDPAKLRPVYWGIDAPPPPSPAERAAAKQRLGIPASSPVIGMLANVTPAKGHLTLLRALAQLRQQAPGFRALLVGDGPFRPTVAAEAEALALSEVQILPRVEDVFEVLPAFDVFALPSDIEGLPYVLLEAMSQALPIVASNVGGIPEAVIHGHTGLLVPPRDAPSLSRALKELVGNPEAAVEMGRAGFRRFLEHFTRTEMIRRHEAIYQEASQP